MWTLFGWKILAALLECGIQWCTANKHIHFTHKQITRFKVANASVKRKTTWTERKKTAKFLREGAKNITTALKCHLLLDLFKCKQYTHFVCTLFTLFSFSQFSARILLQFYPENCKQSNEITHIYTDTHRVRKRIHFSQRKQKYQPRIYEIQKKNKRSEA